MRILGQKIEGVNIETIVIPRGDSQIVFEAQAVLEDQEFEDLCPRPKPRVSLGKGGKKIERTDEPTYVENLQNWAQQRTAWLIIKSLEATEGLEWDTVNYDDPSTWQNYLTELKSSGFSDSEVAMIIGGVFAANGLSEARVEAARQRFLASREAASDSSSSPEDAPLTTPSGGLAND